jgi:hypothetical protein
MQFVRNMLNRQRKRVVATIMGYAEQTFFDRLSEQEKADFRHRVLGAVGQYHDTAFDLINSSVNDGMMLNEEAVRVLAKFNENAARAASESTPSTPLTPPTLRAVDGATFGQEV